MLASREEPLGDESIDQPAGGRPICEFAQGSPLAHDVFATRMGGTEIRVEQIVGVFAKSDQGLKHWIKGFFCVGGQICKDAFSPPRQDAFYAVAEDLVCGEGQL